MSQAGSLDYSEERAFRFHKTLRILGFLITPAAILLLWACSIWFQMYEALPWKGFSDPDDVDAGRRLLAAEQDKPGYFKISHPSSEILFPYITKSDAYAQIKQIMADRHLVSNKEEMMEKIIERLTESAPFRAAGSNLVNILRLNMALDQMPGTPEKK